jgi:hypothetical protein
MANSPIRPDSDEAWDDLLRQLPRQAQPQPFFYGRVQARLAAQTSAEKNRLPVWLLRPAYAVLLSALVFGLSGDGPGLRSASAVAVNSGPAVQLVPR